MENPSEKESTNRNLPQNNQVSVDPTLPFDLELQTSLISDLLNSTLGIKTQTWALNDESSLSDSVEESENLKTDHTFFPIDDPMEIQALPYSRSLQLYTGNKYETFFASTAILEKKFETFFIELDKLRKESKLEREGLRQLDELYLSTILEFMIYHSSRPEKLDILSRLVYSIAQRGDIDINTIVLSFLPKSSVKNTNVWKFFYKFLKKYISSFQQETLIQVFNHILQDVKSLPINLTKTQYENVKKAIKLIDMLVGNKNGGHLSQYSVMIEINQIPHWTLSDCLEPFLRQKQNLTTLLTISDYSKLSRAIGPSRKEELEPTKKFNSNQIIGFYDAIPPPKGNPTVWAQHVESLLIMLREGVSLNNLKSQITPLNLLGGNQSFQSELLQKATIQRILQLSSTPLQTNWEEWQHFSEQFYSFVENELIPFDKFVQTLATSVKNKRNEPLKDNGIIWVLLQCLTLEHVKALLKEDIPKKNGIHHGYFIPWIMSFYNKEQSNSMSHYHELRDTAASCFLLRVHALIGKDSSPEAQKYLATITEKVQTKHVRSYRRWWSQLSQNNEKLNFCKLAKVHSDAVCVLSNFMSRPISQAIIEFLQLDKDGILKPLPIGFLSNLYIQCRQRIFETLENNLFAEKPNEPKSPYLVETYARLLYISPVRYQYRLQNNIRKSEALRLHTLLELVNFRLLRYFRFHSVSKELFFDVFEFLKTVTSHELLENLENLLIKICWNLPSPLRFAKRTESVDFGETLNRIVVLSLARSLQTKGISNFGQIRQLEQLLQRLWDLSPHLWSKNTIKYFPKEMQQFYSKLSKPTKSITMQMINQEFIENRTHWKNMNVEFISGYYKKNPSNKPFLLCVLLILTLQDFTQRKTEFQNASKIFHTFRPQEVVQYTYQFVDFILSEIPQQSSTVQKNPNANQPQTSFNREIKTSLIAEFLVFLVWNQNMIPFETLLLALSCRDEEPNSFILLEYLLLNDPHKTFLKRVEFFLTLDFNKDFWLDDEFFTKQKTFEEKFPETHRTFPKYYGNTCLKIIPILDIIIGRLIENEKTEFLEKLINVYSPLYKFHDNALTFVKDTLVYYYDSPLFQNKPTAKYQFSKLIEHSDMFKSYSSQRPTPIQPNSSKYWDTLINRLSSALRTDSIPSSHFTHQLFSEFPSYSNGFLTCLCIDLLSTPSASKISELLLDLILDPIQKDKPLSFSYLNSVVLVLSSLPSTFHKYLFERATQIFKTDKLFQISKLTQPPTLESFSLSFVFEYSATSSALMDTNAGKMTVLLQLFFHYSSIANFYSYPQLIQSIRPFSTLEQLFVFFKILAPFIYRISFRDTLFKEILMELLDSLIELNDVIHAISCSTYSFVTTTSNNPLDLLGMMIDFFQHCKVLFPEILQSVFEKINNTKAQLCSELQIRLKNF